jgi:hypothetical protein
MAAKLRTSGVSGRASCPIVSIRELPSRPSGNAGQQLLDDIARLPLPQQRGLATPGFLVLFRFEPCDGYRAILKIALGVSVRCEELAQDRERLIGYSHACPAFPAEGCSGESGD